MIDAIFRTNPNEVKEFTQSYFKIQHFIVIFVYFILLFISLKLKINTNKKINNKTNIFIIILVIALILNAAYRDYYKIQVGTGRFVHSIQFAKISSEFYYYIVKFKPARNDFQKMKDSYERIYKSKNKIQAKNDIKNIILILGESTDRNKFGLYSDFLPNTPHLQKLQENDNLVLFNDVISPYANTNPTMSVLLNFANYENSNRPFYTNLDVISLFKLASYKTFFISNQDFVTIWGNVASSVGDLADFHWFVNKDVAKAEQLNSQPDEILFPILKTMQTTQHNFIVIHLMGTHDAYKNRYTQEFNRWNDSDIHGDNYKHLNKKQKLILAQYHNAILYNDYIVKNIYDIFANGDSIYIYLSDHGEAVFDDKTKSVWGHGLTDKTNAEIPFMIMFSDTFKNKHPDLVESIKQAKNKPYMSDDLIHTLCNIAGIYPQEYDSKRSIINENYNEKRKRIFKNEIDYDKEMK